MQSIPKAVETIVLRSDYAYFALQHNVLNLSAYAKQIRRQVQNECKKPVASTAAIIMALSRLQKKIAKKKLSLPNMFITGVTIKKGLHELGIPKTTQSVKQVERIIRSSDGPQALLVTYGLGEINLVVQETKKGQVKKLISLLSPTLVLPNLASITLGTMDGYTFTPNIFYSILRLLATREINVIEIATTHTEITLIVEEAKLQSAYEALTDIFQEKENLY